MPMLQWKEQELHNNNNNNNNSIQFFIINVPSQQQNANYRNSTV
jgi:hypothetical protein